MSRVILCKLSRYGDLVKVFDRTTSSGLSLPATNSNSSGSGSNADPSSKKRLKLDLLQRPEVMQAAASSDSSSDSSLLKLLSGGDSYQTQRLSNHRGFLLTDKLANQIVDMGSGDEVRVMSTTTSQFCPKNLTELMEETPWEPLTFNDSSNVSTPITLNQDDEDSSLTAWNHVTKSDPQLDILATAFEQVNAVSSFSSANNFDLLSDLAPVSKAQFRISSLNSHHVQERS